jgi:membrane protease YdiL (CAAX protease family)
MTEIVGHLLALSFVVDPVCGVASMRRLKRRLAQGDKEARLAAYTWTIVQYWAAAVAVLTWWTVAGRSATSLGLAASGGIPFAVTMTASVLLALVLLGQARAAGSMTSDTARSLRRQMGSADTVVPHTTGERSAFFAVSVSAGFCEELLHRGFLIAYLAQWAGWWQAGLASSVLFGLGHAYQGAAGVLKTTVVGIVMAALYLYCGSLWPSIVLHTAIDVLGGAIGYEALRRTEPEAGAEHVLSRS